MVSVDSILICILAFICFTLIICCFLLKLSETDKMKEDEEQEKYLSKLNKVK